MKKNIYIFVSIREVATQTHLNMPCSRKETKFLVVAAGQTPLFTLVCPSRERCHGTGGAQLGRRLSPRRAVEQTAHRGRMESGIERPQQKDTSLRKPKPAPESYTIVIKDAQPAMPDEIWISVIVSYAAEVYQKAAQRLRVLYYHCTLQWLQLTAYLYFHADSAKRVDLFSVLS